MGAKDPKALESVAKSLSLRPEAVNRDLLTYKARLIVASGQTSLQPDAGLSGSAFTNRITFLMSAIVPPLNLRG